MVGLLRQLVAAVPNARYGTPTVYQVAQGDGYGVYRAAVQTHCQDRRSGGPMRWTALCREHRGCRSVVRSASGRRVRGWARPRFRSP